MLGLGKIRSGRLMFLVSAAAAVLLPLGGAHTSGDWTVTDSGKPASVSAVVSVIPVGTGGTTDPEGDWPWGRKPLNAVADTAERSQ
jgi:hypothetical protein